MEDSLATIEEAVPPTPMVQAELAAENSDVPKAKSKLEDVDSVLKALADQDEALRSVKMQVQEALSVNAMLRKSIKQIVADASKNDELAQELAVTKKKLHVIKQYLG